MIKLTPPPKGYGMPIATAQSRGQMLLWIFALSGFAGLIYQSIWTQYLGLFLGHAAYAQSLVLMLFMGGMALGAWIVSLRSASIRRPLLAYAIIEAVIGVLGLTFDTLYQVGTGLAYVLYYFIIQHLGALRAAGVSYIPPVVALIVGHLLADEPFHVIQLLAVVLILGGISLLQTGRQ